MTERIPAKDVSDTGSAKAQQFDPKQSKQNEKQAMYTKREHIYVRRIRGLFQRVRTTANWILMALYFGVAWLQWGDRQAVWFDLPNRQFHIFGTTFWPQDFVLLSWLLIICAFGLFFVTVFAGRVWCGYTCPQSVWTWLYIWAEEFAEGPRNQRMKLDKQPMSANKLKRKALKHTLWLLFAAATAITFVGYFSPIRELVPNILSFELGPWELWWLFFFTAATYINAGWLREQVCIYMCPYARFQSVMFDPDTLIVSYDRTRGEPRGARKRNADPQTLGLGDCIDCNLCVNVCPVGIDIRDGLQYECITCAACIDACDSVMDKMGYPRGLIRYTTENALEGKPSKILRPRLIGYFIALIAMIGLFTYAVSDRVPLELEVLRDRNQLYREVADGLLENTYTIKIANMDQTTHTYTLSVSGLEGIRLEGSAQVTVAAGEVRNIPIRLQAKRDAMGTPSADIQIHVTATDNAEIQTSKETRFIGGIQR